MSDARSDTGESTEGPARRAVRRTARGPLLAALCVAAVACGTTETSNTTSVPDTTVPDSSTSAPSTTVPSSSVPPSTDTPTTVAPPLEQPAIWPAAGEYFDLPELAAADFVVRVLGVPPVLGPFMAGDSRSGEIEVLSPGGSLTGRGVLFLRQLGPLGGWFVTGIGNDVAAVASPAQGDTVAAGSLTVQGTGYGFEAAISVSAYVAGNPVPLDTVSTQAGSMESPGAFTVTLDLSGASPGDMVMILVRGGVGLETDPGELGAVAVVVG
ncbi:MAG: Gmad2 immunoglobulin-like domain-containing protein [Ilumatobacteraceae bacterium]